MRTNIYNNFFDAEIYKLVNPENIDLLNDYMMELKQNKKSESTQSQYFSDIRIFFMFNYKSLGNKSVLELNKKDFRNYSLYLIGECKLSNARHNRLLSSLRSMLTFAENDDDYEYLNNVAKKVKGLGKEAVRDIIFLTDEQVMKLKNELIKRKKYQEATALLLAYDSAGRKNELAQVKKASFLDVTKSNTNKVIGKRRKVFTLVYFSGTKECANLWLGQRGNDDIESLFIVGHGKEIREASAENLYDWFMDMREILSEIEGRQIDMNVHSLRHSSLEAFSAGTHYLCRELGMTSGFTLDKLKIFAHHESSDTTNNYLKDKSDDEIENMFGIKIIQ